MCMWFSLRKTNPLHFCLYDFFYTVFTRKWVNIPGKINVRHQPKYGNPETQIDIGSIMAYVWSWIFIYPLVFSCFLKIRRVALSVPSAHVLKLGSQELVCGTVGVGWDWRRPEDAVTRFRHHPSENRTRVTCNSWNEKEQK